MQDIGANVMYDISTNGKKSLQAGGGTTSAGSFFDALRVETSKQVLSPTNAKLMKSKESRGYDKLRVALCWIGFWQT